MTADRLVKPASLRSHAVMSSSSRLRLATSPSCANASTRCARHAPRHCVAAASALWA